MDFIWWLIAIVLMAVGLIGTVLPVVPGTVIILAAAMLHQMMLGTREESGVVEYCRIGFADAVVVRAGICGRLFRRETIRRDEMGGFRRHGRRDRRTFLSSLDCSSARSSARLPENSWPAREWSMPGGRVGDVARQSRAG